jgi:hypothetical protein
MIMIILEKKMILGFDDLRSWRFAFMTVFVYDRLRFGRFVFLAVYYFLNYSQTALFRTALFRQFWQYPETSKTALIRQFSIIFSFLG